MFYSSLRVLAEDKAAYAIDRTSTADAYQQGMLITKLV